jgi:hypothetical protein
MPKPARTSVTVPRDLHEKLKEVTVGEGGISQSAALIMLAQLGAAQYDRQAAIASRGRTRVSRWLEAEGILDLVASEPEADTGLGTDEEWDQALAASRGEGRP